MTKQEMIEDFIHQRTLAVVGASRDGKSFGSMALRELKARGYTLYPVHPSADMLEGEACYPNLGALPEKVGGVLVSVPSAQTEQVVQDAHAAGITRVWIQQGAESPAAIRYCEQNGMTVVSGKCILMFADPQSFHKIHRWVNNLFGRLYN
jgi:predicted CoA-binding protein